MNKTLTIQFLVLFLWLFISSALSEDIVTALPQTGGNRAFAIGGTYIAFNQGINALYGNPAGLTTDNRIEIIIGGYWQLYKKMQYEDAYYNRFWYNDNFSFSNDYDKNLYFNQMVLLFQKQIANYPVKIAGAIGLSPFYNLKNTRHSERNYSYETGSGVTVHYSEIGKEKMDGLYDLLNIGISITTNAIGSIGISMNYPINKQYKQDNSSTYYYERNGEVDKNGYEDDISQKVSADNFIRIGGILHLTSDLSIGLLWNQTYHYNIGNDRRTFPATLNFGLAYRILSQFLIAFDIQNQPWEKVKLNDTYLYDAKNGNSYRCGFEYSNKIIFRTGYALDRLPILDSKNKGVNLNNITLGIAYPTKSFVFDLGMRYRFTTFDSETFSNNTFNYIIRDLVFQSSLKLSVK